MVPFASGCPSEEGYLTPYPLSLKGEGEKGRGASAPLKRPVLHILGGEESSEEKRTKGVSLR